MGLATTQHTDAEVGSAGKKPNTASAPSLLFRAAWAGRQADASQVLCSLRVSAAPTQVWTVLWTVSIHIEILFWPEARAFC